MIVAAAAAVNPPTVEARQLGIGRFIMQKGISFLARRFTVGPDHSSIHFERTKLYYEMLLLLTLLKLLLLLLWQLQLLRLCVCVCCGARGGGSLYNSALRKPLFSILCSAVAAAAVVLFSKERDEASSSVPLRKMLKVAQSLRGEFSPQALLLSKIAAD